MTEDTTIKKLLAVSDETFMAHVERIKAKEKRSGNSSLDTKPRTPKKRKSVK